MKDSKLKNENWERYLPQFHKKNVKRRKPHKINVKKEYTPFPPAQMKSKIDLQLESGEYFLNQNIRQQEEKLQKKNKKRKEKLLKREQIFIPPKNVKKNKKRRRKKEEKEEEENIQQIAHKIKQSINQSKNDQISINQYIEINNDLSDKKKKKKKKKKKIKKIKILFSSSLKGPLTGYSWAYKYTCPVGYIT